MQRAEDETKQMLSRAQALDELMDSGALDDATLPAGDAMTSKPPSTPARTGPSDIDGELARLQGRLSAAPVRPALDAGTDTDSRHIVTAAALTRRPGRDHPRPRAMYAGFTIGVWPLPWTGRSCARTVR